DPDRNPLIADKQLGNVPFANRVDREQVTWHRTNADHGAVYRRVNPMIVAGVEVDDHELTTIVAFPDVAAAAQLAHLVCVAFDHDLLTVGYGTRSHNLAV